MIALHTATSQRNRSRGDAINFKQVEGESAAKNIGDAVKRTHLMEMHFIDSGVVYGCLGLGQHLESIEGALLGPVGHA